ncbi:hypothetical protein [Falsiroseomonas ponticola]|uniref:hypothetical protein n=1 Tax=Falsiroseomonas ponticola TaxID=2786951 RepID=UPI00193183D1|nr:hypothetical protein [Roseomonas ponticola]
MRLVHGRDIDFTAPRTRHREPGILFKHLLTGAPGTPDCYELSLTRVVTRYEAPRHRHNFDQVRWQLAGRFGDGKGEDLPAGWVGYYPEGTYYAIDATGPCEQLTLQCGAPTGSGFMPYDQLFASAAELAKLGSFQDGIYRRHDASNLPPGVKRNQDGYEAVWQHAMGTPVVYPRPRFAAPLLMDPDAFAWIDAGGGAARREMGRFTERGVTIAQLRLAAGGAVTETARARRLFYVLAGEGLVQDQAILPESAIELAPGEEARFASAGGMVLAALTLPDFSLPAAMAAAA